MKVMDEIDLQEFIKTTIEKIENGVDLETRTISSPIEFDIKVAKTQRIDGGLKVIVASSDAGLEKEEITTVKFSVQPKESERHKQQQVLVQSKA